MLQYQVNDGVFFGRRSPRLNEIGKSQTLCFSSPDIALEPDKAVKKVEENLKLGLTDEEAVQHLQNLLDVSISAVMPALVEQIHKLAQYWRK